MTYEEIKQMENYEIEDLIKSLQDELAIRGVLV